MDYFSYLAGIWKNTGLNTTEKGTEKGANEKSMQRMWSTTSGNKLLQGRQSLL